MRFQTSETLRVLLVDDNWAFLGSAEHFLCMEPHLQIVGCVASGQDAVEQVRLLAPDLVLMDLAMPGMTGLMAARLIKAMPHPPRVIILTVHDQPEYHAAAEAAGADGFVAKSEFGSELLPLIDRLFKRNSFVAQLERREPEVSSSKLVC
jgi:DNA-binding NarL/FixJ family response regulator